MKEACFRPRIQSMDLGRASAAQERISVSAAADLGLIVQRQSSGYLQCTH